MLNTFGHGESRLRSVRTGESTLVCLVQKLLVETDNRGLMTPLCLALEAGQ